MHPEIKKIQARVEKLSDKAATLRKQVAELSQRRDDLEIETERETENLAALTSTALRPAPMPSFVTKWCHEAGDVVNMPSVSGIYFLWRFYEGSYQIVYVGKSINLSQRVCASHNIIKPGDGISYLEFPESEINRVEHFYVFFYDPPLNGGGRGTISGTKRYFDDLVSINEASRQLGTTIVRARSALKAISANAIRKRGKECYRRSEIDAARSALDGR